MSFSVYYGSTIAFEVIMTLLSLGATLVYIFSILKPNLFTCTAVIVRKV